MAVAEKDTKRTWTLRGFSKALDNRPIEFSRPPPPQHICGLCGVVSMAPVLPGCLHTFCGSCYQLVSSESPPMCPRDQTTIYLTNFATASSSTERAIVREYGMRCPNFPHGCAYVLKSDSNIADLEGHYSACEYHAVSCRVCGTSVARGKIVDHLMDSCKTAAVDSVEAMAKKVVLDDVE
ncbi:TNF receptor-associated factor 4-like [Ixodes scapularis]|uniref:TNF receptor-associated factor 4-like n=1 Tax=Ixodes scapularis TaxID=6945 RepID=UPI001C382C4B|nr:TNF receptor-associated factor 4-like [Ixodes scapularis]